MGKYSFIDKYVLGVYSVPKSRVHMDAAYDGCYYYQTIYELVSSVEM